MNNFQIKQKPKTLTYVLSCLTKLEKLLCLKYIGSRSLANSVGFHTTKLQPVGLHDTMESDTWSSTSSYVFKRNGAGALEPPPCDPSIFFFFFKFQYKLQTNQAEESARTLCGLEFSIQIPKPRSQMNSEFFYTSNLGQTKKETELSDVIVSLKNQSPKCLEHGWN